MGLFQVTLCLWRHFAVSSAVFNIFKDKQKDFLSVKQCPNKYCSIYSENATWLIAHTMQRKLRTYWDPYWDTIETLCIPTVYTFFLLVILSCWVLETELDFIQYSDLFVDEYLSDLIRTISNSDVLSMPELLLLHAHQMHCSRPMHFLKWQSKADSIMWLLAPASIVELAKIFQKQTDKGCEELWMTSVSVVQAFFSVTSTDTCWKFDWSSMF